MKKNLIFATIVTFILSVSFFAGCAVNDPLKDFEKRYNESHSINNTGTDGGNHNDENNTGGNSSGGNTWNGDSNISSKPLYIIGAMTLDDCKEMKSHGNNTYTYTFMFKKEMMDCWWLGKDDGSFINGFKITEEMVVNRNWTNIYQYGFPKGQEIALICNNSYVYLTGSSTENLSNIWLPPLTEGITYTIIVDASYLSTQNLSIKIIEGSY